ncbi:MAG: tetratricopeptide repeat protein [Candidatus Wallbacteria bacterium]|nr:tetratricopeptide repeat protein [Candidatus Wallbacteria bacterium]
MNAISKSLRRALPGVLLVLAVSASFAASASYEKGLEDGRKFGQQAGAAKGTADGQAAAERDGFAKGMEDERTDQPPPGDGSEPPTPPSTGVERGSEIGDPESAERIGQEALARYPDLMPKASTLATTGEAPAGESQDGLDYSKGFALGLAAGFAETYAAARLQGYEQAYPAAYARGRAEYRRLYRRPDGSVIDAKTQYELGRQALLLNRFDEAIHRFDIAIASEGAADVLAPALYYKAKAYYDWSKPKEALHVLVKLLTDFAESAYADDGYFLAGAAYEKTPAAGLGGLFGKRRFPQARDAYRTLTVKYPQSPIAGDAFFRLGYTSEKVGDKPAAIAAYRTMIEKFPDHPLASEARSRLARLESR